MASAGGIITLQAGRFANFVGAHFWNLQDEALGYLTGSHAAAAEEICVGKLFSQGSQLRPRLLMLDAKGCQGGVRLHLDDPAYTGNADELANAMWGGTVQVLQAEPVPKSSFYSLLETETEEVDDGDMEAEDVEKTGAAQTDEVAGFAEAAEQLDSGSGPRYFTDFLKVFLHPRTVVEVPDLWHKEDEVSAFGEFRSEPEHSQVVEDIMDRLSSQAEACDTLEGFHLLADDSGAWGGAAASLLSQIQDDYPRQPVFLFSTRPPRLPDADSDIEATISRRAAVNMALAAAEMGPNCSLFAPLDIPLPTSPPTWLPHFAFDISRPFHTAALQAAAIDTATLCYRVRPWSHSAAASNPSTLRPAATPSCGATSMAEVASMLTQPASKFVALGTTFPLAVELHESAPAALDSRMSARERRLRGVPTVPPRCDLVSRDLSWFCDGWNPCHGLLAESVVARGVQGGGGSLPCSQVLDCVRQSLEEEGIQAVRHLSALAMPVAIPLPFPAYFSRGLNSRNTLRALAAETEEPPRKLHLSPQPTGTEHGPEPTPVAASPPSPKMCSMVTRLASTKGFEAVLKGQARVLLQATRAGDGKQWLQRSGYERDDALELRETLLRTSRSFQQYDSDGMSSAASEVSDL